MELEVKVSFQEHTIAQLDEVIRTLVDRVESLEERMQQMQLEHQASLAPVDEKPPHY